MHEALRQFDAREVLSPPPRFVTGGLLRFTRKEEIPLRLPNECLDIGLRHE